MTTLDEARAWLRANIDDGVRCPCCTQFAKVYRRTIHSTMARDLCVMYRAEGDGWFHIRNVGYSAGDFAKLAYWGLVEESTEPRDDTGGRAGYWRVTPKGAAFVAGRLRVPKRAHIYNGRCLGFDDSKMVGVRDALGKRFDFEELMTGRSA